MGLRKRKGEDNVRERERESESKARFGDGAFVNCRETFNASLLERREAARKILSLSPIHVHNHLFENAR